MGSFTNNALVSLVVSFRSLFASRRHRAVLVSVALILVLAVSTYAYLRSLPPAVGPRVSLVTPPLEFSMEFDKAEFQQGENVTVTLAMKNTDSKEITLMWTSFYQFLDRVLYFDICITDSNGTVVFQWSRVYFALGMVLEKSLNPGEQLTSMYFWYQEKYHYPEGQKPEYSYQEGQVPKGIYYIRGLSRQFTLTADGQTTPLMTLETPSITIQII